jgi:hypothetical protein
MLTDEVLRPLGIFLYFLPDMVHLLTIHNFFCDVSNTHIILNPSLTVIQDVTPFGLDVLSSYPFITNNKPFKFLTSSGLHVQAFPIIEF